MSRERNLCPVAAAAQRAPEALALVAGSTRWTYAQLEAEVARWQTRLERLVPASSQGTRRIAVLSNNSPALLAVIHAAARAGIELALLNARLAAPELASQLLRLAPAPCLASPELAHLLPSPQLLRGDEEPAPVRAADAGPIDPARVHALLFTSGTTGTPRLAQLTVGALQASARAVNQVLKVNERSFYLLCLPLFHVGGLGIALRSALAGATVVLHERFDAAAVAQVIDSAAGAAPGGADSRVVLSLVASTLARLLDQRRSFPSTVQAALIGGGPVPPDLLARARRAGIPALETYGLTEASSSVTIDGLPLPGTEVRIVDGEIEVRGPTLMRGYLGEAPLDQRGLRTGDLGTLDGDGRLTVLARRTDLILSGGENVYPAEVEAALLAHPLIAEAAVLPAPDPRWGQVGVAALVLRPEPGAPAAKTGAEEGDPPLGSSEIPPDLDGFLRARLATFKIPRRFVGLAALPRTALGKIDRPALLKLLGA